MEYARIVLDAAEKALAEAAAHPLDETTALAVYRLLFTARAELAGAKALVAYDPTVSYGVNAFITCLAEGAAVKTCNKIRGLLERIPGLKPTQVQRHLRRVTAEASQRAVQSAHKLLFTCLPADEGNVLREIATNSAVVAEVCSLDLNDETLCDMGEHLSTAADDFLQAAEWMYQKTTLLGQPDEAAGGALPFLRLCALVIGATRLSRAVLSGIGEPALTRFYCENLLPHAKALSISCTRGTRTFGPVRDSA